MIPPDYETPVVAALSALNVGFYAWNKNPVNAAVAVFCAIMAIAGEGVGT